MKVSNDALTERVYSNPVVSLANINMAANKKRKTAYGRKWEYVKYDCQ